MVVTVTLLLTVNSLAPWGDEVAHRIAAVAQCCTGGGAVTYGLVVARRFTGVSRWWRLLSVGAVAALLAGQIVWWVGDEGWRVVWVVLYWLFPVLALAAVLLLAWAGGGVGVPVDGSPRHTPVLTLLDGMVAATSFAILVIIAGFGATSTSSLPRSGDTAVEISYGLVELIVVVIAAVTGMVYQPEQPYRPNYLQLGAGVMVIASSDRVAAYLDSVGAQGGAHWAGLGLALGFLLIALSMRDRPSTPAGSSLMDWAQLILPYSGFLGITLLLAVHVLRMHRLGPVVVAVTVGMVILVAARQVVAMNAQRLMTRRLYDAQRSLAHQVLHDPLTGLPNRLMFARRLDEAMRDSEFVLIFVDLDDFKEVNDRFGHAAGDELLRAVGERLKRCVSEEDTLARIGGDEFAILVDAGHEVPEVVADRLRVALRDPFPLHGSSLRVRASMGLVHSEGGAPGQTSDDLLRQADISMYAGKRLGKDTAVVYQPSAGVRADFASTLRGAAGGVPAGFSLVYQPVVRLPEETLVAVEALARWTAPNGIQIPPETFVAAAEAAGLGAVLDGLVLDMACRGVDAAGLDVDIHVNIGAARLGNPGFEEHVRRTLKRYRIKPSRLVLEITETLPIVDLADAAAQIARLNDIGVRVALDDFGAGYNSLTYLHALPVQIVKLDRSLAVGSEAVRDLTLYRSVVGLCEDLRLNVIAEGIESTAQANTIVAAGCSLAQGHLFGRPAPIADITQEYDHLRRKKRAGERQNDLV